MAQDKEHYWQYYLKSNTLTTDNLDDCVAEILTAPQTLRNENLAKEIIRRGSELEPETILYIINMRDRIVTEKLLDGHSVITDICQFTPRITGVFPLVPFQTISPKC